MYLRSRIWRDPRLRAWKGRLAMIRCRRKEIRVTHLRQREHRGREEDEGEIGAATLELLPRKGSKEVTVKQTGYKRI